MALFMNSTCETQYIYTFEWVHPSSAHWNATSARAQQAHTSHITHHTNTQLSTKYINDLRLPTINAVQSRNRSNSNARHFAACAALTLLLAFSVELIWQPHCWNSVCAGWLLVFESQSHPSFVRRFCIFVVCISTMHPSLGV